VKSPVAAPVYREASGPLSLSTVCAGENLVVPSRAEQHLPDSANCRKELLL
jgi:hypothetical protein